MSLYTENDVEIAMEKVASGVPVGTAAKLHGIPRHTLRGRCKGAGTVTQANNAQQLLSKEQEERLATWAKVQDSLGLAPTHNQLRYVAEIMLQESGREISVGRHWVRNFLCRNPSVKALKGKRVTEDRVNGATPDRIKAFITGLQEPLIRHIRSANRWNIDETGLMEGAGGNGKVIGCAKRRFAVKKASGSRIWTSILECVSAEGNFLPPAVIFTGKNVQAQWYPEDLEPFKDWYFDTSDNGWTSNDIGLKWLKEVFIPRTDPGPKE